SFYQQSENVYWVGTLGNGFNRLTINRADNTYEIEQFDYTDKMANLIVIGLLVDDTESPNLWISAHGGLYVFNIESRYLRKLNPSEGIQGLEFNEGAYLKDTSGSLYFGGVDGFNMINPNKFNQSSFNPPLRLSSYDIVCEDEGESCTEIKTMFERYAQCLLSTDACTKKIVEFPYDSVSFSLRFSALDYTIPEVNQYRYRLTDGSSSPWQELGTRNEITFSRLDSGNYELEIQGTNYVGRWSDNSLKLAFTVEKPWYLENYTLVSTLMFLMISLYFYAQNRRYKTRQQYRIERAIRKNEQNFKTVLWGSGDELWEWHLGSDTVERTNPIKHIAANKEDRIPFQDLLAIIHPEDVKLFENDMQALLQREIPYSETSFRIRSKKTDYLWVLARGRVVERNEDGTAKRVLGSLKDITALKATEDKLTLIAQAFENTKDAISVVDTNFTSIFNNKAFYDLTGLSMGEGINKQYLFSQHSNNYNMQSQVKTALQSFGKWEGEIWESRSNGEQFAMDLKIAVVEDTPEEMSNYICVFSDITYKKRSEEELVKLANIDSLTNLPNRSLFLDRLSHAIAYSKRNDAPFALLFVDLDNFKNINDTLGHTTGDKMLQTVAERLKSCVRDVDTVARLGGDEFTVILENIHNTNEVGVCANKILDKLSKPMQLDNSIELKTTSSIGIGMFPEHGLDQENILKNADLAMYSAKAKGKNNYQFFTEDMTSLAMERVSIEGKLREAIDNNELALYYQPKVYSVNCEVTGFEALVRWIHPEDGIISPAAFIPVAEETGLIIRLGAWILEEAIRQSKEWSLINPACARVAVNISAKQFMSEDLPAQIQSLLAKYDLEAKFIEIEITEGTLMENMQHTISTLHRLR
ncbi:MAG: diguanylate cyclase, partial [Gammaproteobacteria bacterium]|nr:diguanylate cyclase [Gammaproteobacteria bacterium]